LQVAEIDSEPVEFRSLNCKEYSATKQKGSNLVRFRNCNQPTKFRSLNYKEHPTTKQEGPIVQASKTFNISRIQSSDWKEDPTTKREGSEIAELQKIEVRHLQIRSKEHS